MGNASARDLGVVMVALAYMLFMSIMFVDQSVSGPTASALTVTGITDIGPALFAGFGNLMSQPFVTGNWLLACINTFMILMLVWGVYSMVMPTKG